MFKASILVTSYNQRATVELLLESLRRQTEQDFEVVIADDGSSDGTSELCANFKGLEIVFVTQPDVGYRKAKILNSALRVARSDYWIFVDGDVILEKHFIEDHLKLRKEGHFVCGRRVDLGPKFTSTITVEQVRKGQFDGLNMKLLKSTLDRDSLHFNRSLRVVNSLVRRVFKYDRPIDILGSNFSAWKKDVVAVNGFNEAMESYWGEDGDIYIRLRNMGCRAIGAKAICVQFHVFHPRREPTKENMERFYRLLKDTEYKWAAQGLKI